MKYLLNAINIFGHTYEWKTYETIVWLIVIQAVLAVLAISIIIFVLMRRRLQDQSTVYTVAQPTAQNTEVVYVTEPQKEVERVLTGITLDLGVVQRAFVAGDGFTCEGLVVNGEFNVSPTSESILEFTLIDNDTYTRLAKKDKTHGTVYVIKPYMYTAGIKVVTVKYENMSASYTISVEERQTKVVEQPAPVVEEKTQPIVQNAEPTTIVIEKPAEEKTRELMYIWIDTDKVKKDYFVGESIDHDGLVVIAHFNVEPFEEEVTDYSVLSPDMSKQGKPTVTVTYQGKTVGYQITVNFAPQVAENEEKVEEISPQVTVEEQHTVVEQQQTIVVKRADPIIVEEDSVDSRLRYDKSFTARLIQSDDDVKYWYTEIKNELLSYKGVKGRISWKRETFKCGGKLVLAKLAYRGKRLCLFLPLNPYDYGEDMHIENAADISCYEDTPLMIRLKNRKRVEIAKKLIRTVMENNKMMQVPHESVDYYIPYEGILELIKKGLIKRDIRTAQEEAIFERDLVGATLPSDEEEDESFALEQVAPGIYITKKE
ncbi:MAG: bacterial Ig-like domain-containing protein [Clostridiales bacterium]|nr:bacterial Ig-like domain-containing protein [Clostridiales bacterium]